MMDKLRARTLLMIAILAITLLSGCWDYREIDELAYVLALGVDKGKDDQVEVTVQIVKPAVASPRAEGGGGQEEPVEVLTGKGFTIFDALLDLQAQLPKRPDYSHCRVIIFGEDFAREGIKPTLDVITRQRQFRRRTWLLVAKGEGKEALGAGTRLEKVSALALFDMLQTRESTSTAVGAMLNDFRRQITSDVKSAVASTLEIVKAGGGAKQGGAQQQGGGQQAGGAGGGGQGQEKPTLKLTGASVFKDGRLVGWLDERQTRGYLWVQGETNRALIIVKSPQDEKTNIGIRVERADSEIIPRTTDDPVSFMVKIWVEGSLTEVMGPLDVFDNKTWASLERRFAQVVRNDILNLLQKSQQDLQVDVTMLGETLRKRYPDQWKKLEGKWDEVYPQIVTDVEIVAKLRRPGLAL